MGIKSNKEAYQMVKNTLGSIENRFREAYNKGYKDGLKDGASQVTAKLVSKILEETEADTPQTDKDKVVCPNCGRSDYIRSFEKDFGIKNSEYRYKCINCNTYIKDTPQTEETCERCVYVRGSQWCQGCNGTPKRWDGEKIVDTPQTDCGWGEPNE